MSVSYHNTGTETPKLNAVSMNIILEKMSDASQVD